MTADPAAGAIRARVLLHSDAGEEALSESRRAAELAPRDGRVHLFLGLAAWRCERLTLGQQSLERAIELSGGNPGMLVDYAWFMAVERGPRLAEDAALEAVAANETSSTAWAALGLVQSRLHERDEAQKSLDRAMTLDPDDPFNSMARAYTELFIVRGDDYKEQYIKNKMDLFNVDGIIYHDAKTCPNNYNCRYGMPQRLAEQTGIPSLTINGDLNDLRLLSDEQTKTNVEAFIEQLEEG